MFERGPEGLSAGAIVRVGFWLPSSLTFHLQNLQRAGLITQRRVSRQLFYSVDFALMEWVGRFLPRIAAATVVPNVARQPSNQAGSDKSPDAKPPAIR